MKKVILTSLVVLFTTLSFAQAFSGKGAKNHSISLNASHFHHLKDQFFYRGGNAYGFIGQGEYGIHQYVGIGWQASVGWGRQFNNAWSSSNSIYLSGGFTANFHFYQLIADKTGENIASDQLDIYAGLNLGFGFGGYFYQNVNGGRNSYGFPIAYGGGHLGLRWYPNAGNIGLMVEAGYGKTYASFGVVFR